MSTFSKTAREVEMPNGDIVVLHNAVTENTTSNIKKFKYDDNGHVTESTAANATDLNLNSYSTPTTGSTAIGTSDAVQTAIGKLDHQSQIDQSNILYGLEKIGTNLIKPRDDLPTVVTALPEGLRVQRSNTTSSFAYVKCGTVYLESGKKYALYDATYAPTTKHHYFYVDCGGNGFIELSTPSLTATVQYGTGRTTGTYDIYTRIDANSTVDSISTPIICLESVWKQLDSYTPYGAPNYDLTRLEAEDRASLAEVVDSGAKNLWNFANAGTQTVYSSTITKTDTDVTVTSTGTYGNVSYGFSLPAGNYVFSCKISNINVSGSASYQPRIILANNTSGTNAVGVINFTTNGTKSLEFTWTGGTIYVQYQPNASGNSFKASENMICTKAAFGVSQKFVPHRVPYDVLDRQVPIVKFAQPTTGTDYQCISDIAFNIPKKSASTIAADRIYRITACACFSNSRPTGVIISRSNDPSNYTNSGQLVAKEERSADSTEGSLTKSVIWFNGSEVNDQNLYVWVKYNSSAQNRIYAVLEYLQN